MNGDKLKGRALIGSGLHAPYGGDTKRIEWFRARCVLLRLPQISSRFNIGHFAKVMAARA